MILMTYSFCSFWANNLHSGSALAGENLQDCQSRHSDLLGMEYSISCPAALMFIFWVFSYFFLFPIFCNNCSNTHKVFPLFLYEFPHVDPLCHLSFTCYTSKLLLSGRHVLLNLTTIFSANPPLHKLVCDIKA